MKRFRNFILAVTGLAVFVLATALINTTPAGAQNNKVDPVKVVNTAADWAAPVPVQLQGTTNIAGSVGITGTPNVSIVNTPTVGIDRSNNTVQVGNTGANPVLVRDVDNPASHAFQASASLTITYSNGVTITTVPEGKRLVIEYVSATGFLPSGQKFNTVAIGTTLGGQTVGYCLIPTLLGPAGGAGGNDRFAISQQVRLYADPGTDVIAAALREETTGLGNLTFSISGYFVDLP